MTGAAGIVESRPVSVDEFIRRTQALNGTVIRERPFWNTVATADSIRQFAWGISDDNPLWLDRDYAAQSPHGRRLAPPAFLTSVQYPVVHGSEPRATLAHLVGEVEFVWHQPIFEGDELEGKCRQTGCFESARRQGQRSFFVQGATEYRNGRGEEVGTAKTTLVWVDRQGQMLLDRPTYSYSEQELQALKQGVLSERRRGAATPSDVERQPGQALPSIVRGPLTLGDLICWHTAAGPNYRASSLAFKDHLESPHGNVLHPIFSWPVKTSQQHEDPLLCLQRGIPGPFDNGVMRFSWVTPLLTNWMGDRGMLKRLSLRMLEANLYGDATWFHGRVLRREAHPDGELITISVRGENQLGSTTTAGDAEVLLPRLERTVTRGPTTAVNVEAPSADMSPPLDPVAALTALAEQHPNKAAVACQRRTLTYAELSDRVETLAMDFVAQGLKPGMVVGVCLPRSLDLVAVIFAVLKAEAAYLPLAPDQSRDRNITLLNDAGAALVVSSANYWLTNEVSTAVAEANAAIAELSIERWSDQPMIHDGLASIIYTSGSSGVPKGVLTSRDSLSRYIPEARALLELEPNDTCLHSASIMLSASVRQLFVPLSAGATLVVADTDQVMKPAKLLQLINDAGVTVWDTVPTILAHALEAVSALSAERSDALFANRLRLIACTGEPLPWRLANQWRAKLPQLMAMVNLYSQTETGSVCAFCIRADDEVSDMGTVPLGRPIGRVPVHLLDRSGQQVPDGVMGELWIGGDRLSVGYLNDEDLNVEKFSTDGERLFRTGDMAIVNTAGNLEYVGRRDQQIKIRGIRVQPAEIEHALRQHPDVSAAVVVLRGGSDGEAGALIPEHRLVAFIETPTAKDSAETPLSMEDCRRFLMTRLPGYMVPTDLLLAERLPRMANGKVDREALLYLNVNPDLQSGSYVAPNSATERKLSGIWGELLGLEKVSVEADFFELGGHSLMAARLLTRIKEIFGLDISMPTFFAEPTIRCLARLLNTDAQ